MFFRLPDSSVDLSDVAFHNNHIRSHLQRALTGNVVCRAVLPFLSTVYTLALMFYPQITMFVRIS